MGKANGPGLPQCGDKHQVTFCHQSSRALGVSVFEDEGCPTQPWPVLLQEALLGTKTGRPCVSHVCLSEPALSHWWGLCLLWGSGKAVPQSRGSSLLVVPASALMLFSPTVAPARPCRVPREVREFMAAPAVELGVEAATEKQEERIMRGMASGGSPPFHTL